MYVNQPELLKEGERNHTLSVFVADEAGMINRVAGVFARRGGMLHACVPSEAAGMLGCGCCWELAWRQAASWPSPEPWTLQIKSDQHLPV